MRCSSDTQLIAMRGKGRGVAGLLALFLVLFAPLCWFGTIQRAIAATDIPANGSEEEHEHSKSVARSAQSEGRAAQRPPTPATRLETGYGTVKIVASSSGIRPDVAPPLHPSRFSVRRLI